MTTNNTAQPEPRRIVVPPALRAMGESLQPIAENIRRQMAETPDPVPVTTPDLVNLMGQHLCGIEDFIERLTKEVNALGTICAEEAASDEDTDAAPVHRLAGRLELCVEGALKNYAEARSLQPESEYTSGRDRLAAIHRRNLEDVLDFLDRVVTATLNPMQSLQGRDPSSIKEEGLDIGLKLTAGTQVKELSRWVQKRTEELQQQAEDSHPHEFEVTLRVESDDDEYPRKTAEPAEVEWIPREEPPPRLGFWGHVAAAVIGFGIADWLFFDD